jgi:hypothetical protein
MILGAQLRGQGSAPSKSGYAVLQLCPPTLVKPHMETHLITTTFLLGNLGQLISTLTLSFPVYKMGITQSPSQYY